MFVFFIRVFSTCELVYTAFREMTHQVAECQQHRGLDCGRLVSITQYSGHTNAFSFTHMQTHTGAAIVEVALLFTPFLGCCTVAMALE